MGSHRRDRRCDAFHSHAEGVHHRQRRDAEAPIDHPRLSKNLISSCVGADDLIGPSVKSLDFTDISAENDAFAKGPMCLNRPLQGTFLTRRGGHWPPLCALFFVFQIKPLSLLCWQSKKKHATGIFHLRSVQIPSMTKDPMGGLSGK